MSIRAIAMPSSTGHQNYVNVVDIGRQMTSITCNVVWLDLPNLATVSVPLSNGTLLTNTNGSLVNPPTITYYGTTVALNVMQTPNDDGSVTYDFIHPVGINEFFVTVDLPANALDSEIRHEIRTQVAAYLTANGMTCLAVEVATPSWSTEDPDYVPVDPTQVLYDGKALGPRRIPTAINSFTLLRNAGKVVRLASTGYDFLKINLTMPAIKSSSLVQWWLFAYLDRDNDDTFTDEYSGSPVWSKPITGSTTGGKRLSETFDLRLLANAALTVTDRVLLVPGIVRVNSGDVALRAAGLTDRVVVRLE